jgi:HEPN domain-containing protein
VRIENMFNWLGRLIERYIEKRVPPVSREAIEAEVRKRHAEIGSRVARRKVGG